MAITRPTKVSPPPLNVPITSPQGMPTPMMVDFLYRLWIRTGGNEDKPEVVREQADTAQDTAKTGIEKADTAQGRASQAYDLAEAGQVPVGGIMPIAGGYDIPDNWALCNGASGTPDLRGLFIVGASTASPAGTTGGADSATVTTEPGGATNTGTGTAVISTETAGAATGTDINAVTSVSAEGHTHPNPDHTHDVTVATVPPYYAMALIMRIE